MIDFKQEDISKALIGEDGQPKYSIFLPAISSFYSRQLAYQKDGVTPLCDDSRNPSGFERGIQGMNFLDKKNGYFYYPWALYSAGHADMDLSKPNYSEKMIYERDKPNTLLVGDSGGFQVGKGVWEADWKDPNCPRALAKRKEVLSWLEQHMDYGMVLDIPPWISSEKAMAASGIHNFNEAMTATMINNEYFMKHKSGACKFLNVLQGNSHTEAEIWYRGMKKFCDPKQYETPFNGWAYGSQPSADPHLALTLLVKSRFDGLLEEGKHDWVHFLGNSNLEWSLLLSDIQRSIRKYHNKKFTISYDCASPFLTAVYGSIAYKTFDPEKTDWRFFLGYGIDDKKYSTDTRSLKDIFEQDGVFKEFYDSPISERLMGKDICIYGPGDLNKIGKEGRTSWDSFTYALIMAHNVYMHIETVMEANRQYDLGKHPSAMTTLAHGKKKMLHYGELVYCKDIIDAIFAESDYDKALALVDHFSKYWMKFSGRPNLNIGVKTKNSVTAFNSFFE